MSRRSDYIRLLQDPYAELSIEEERTPRREYINRLQNPYASLEVSEEVAQTRGGQTTLGMDAGLKGPIVSGIEAAEGPVFRAGELGVSQSEFETRCRRIFRQYMPSEQGKRLRPEYLDFIGEGKAKNARRRAAIVRELERYDLALLGSVKPYLNRERENNLRGKLRSILETPEA
jgi:hypothetical protein